MLGGPVEAAQRIRSGVPPKERLQEANAHHQFALEQYHKAIKGMREFTPDQHIRTMLITCLITSCFEALHGNQDSALVQLQNGIALVQDWKKNERNASIHPLGFSSPAPDTIEDYLIQFFGRLEIQSISFRDSRPAETHFSLKEEGKEVIQNMPKLLTSLHEAQVYLDLIVRRMMHYTASLTFSQAHSLPDQEKIPQLGSVSMSCGRADTHVFSSLLEWVSIGLDFQQLPGKPP